MRIFCVRSARICIRFGAFLFQLNKLTPLILAFKHLLVITTQLLYQLFKLVPSFNSFGKYAITVFLAMRQMT
jgi:hypothetical protein